MLKKALFLWLLIAVLALGRPAGAQISYLIPDNDTTDIPLNTKVLVTFDRAMQASSITTSTFTIDSGGTYNVTYDADFRTAILTPTLNLTASTNYICTLTTGIRDSSGNQIFANNVTWNFTTGATTNTSNLEVSSVTPVNGTNDTSRTPQVAAVFKTFINPLTLAVSSFYLKGIKGLVTYDPGLKKVVYLLNQELGEEQTYTAVITTDVEDIYGNTLAAEYHWSFTTADEGGCFIDLLKPAGSKTK